MVTITVTKTGSLKVMGEFILKDHEGNEIPLPNAGNPEKPVSLCRCGASSKKPFCDGAHSKIGFLAGELAQKLADGEVGATPPTPSPTQG